MTHPVLPKPASSTSGRGRTRAWLRSVCRLLGLGGLFGGIAGGAHAVDLPPDRAEAMVHLYSGGGVNASGPALLVRKSILDKVSLAATYYVDMVSNASVDVVTTASPYSETRQQLDLSADYAVRDSLIRVSASHSQEPDYTANTWGVDVTQELLEGLTTVSLGFTQGRDQVGQKGLPGYFDHAQHWQYRLGVTQIISPRWLASANLEAIADEGFLGSPYRAARVFGTLVPERNPRTRSSRAMKLRALGDVSGLFGWMGAARQAVRAEYRYYWDNWAIQAHTVELGYSRYFGDAWLADASVRLNHQSAALFYSDNARSETLYVSRNRQLSAFNSIGLGAKLAYTWKKVPGQYEIKLNGAYEFVRFDYQDFTDIRTGQPYAFSGHVLQLYVTANF